MNKTKVIFRADGNSDIGLGHVIRSLALAEMLKDNFDCVFAIQAPDEPIKEKIQKVCNSFIELPLCSASGELLAAELERYLTGKEIVVLDGYKFDTEYQILLKRRGCALVCIDDIHAYHFVADAVINHAGGVSVDKYSLEPYTNCYLGPNYALLRPPFLGVQTINSNIKNTHNLLINMGGADPVNQTCSIVNKVINYSYFKEIHVVIGAAYKFKEKLEKIIFNNSNTYLHSNLDAEGMANLMKKCGIAICPPSSVSFEYASLGGLLFLKLIADNQKEVKQYFLSNYLALDFDYDFGNILSNEPEKALRDMIQVQKTILDGRSNERLRAIFNKINIVHSLSLRPVSINDMLLCYAWANDSTTRAFSYNSEVISFEDHQKWFKRKISDKLSKFYIAEYNGKPVGQVRFEGDEEKCISYLIAPEMRGYGLGIAMLRKSILELLKKEQGVNKIFGYVKKTNLASCKIFEKAGFINNQIEQIPYPESFKYELNLNA